MKKVNSKIGKDGRVLLDNFFGEKPLIVSKENQKYINSYLTQVKERSDRAHNTQKAALRFFFENVNKPVIEITKIDIKHYFDRFLNEKTYVKNNEEVPISITTKEAHRSYLSSFFSHVEQLYLNDEKIFVNPVPNRKVYQFSSSRKDIKKFSDKPKEVLSNEQLLLILEYCKKNLNTLKQKKYFIFFCLETITGARPAELLSIKIKDINLEERYFETGFEKNSRKSTNRTKQALLFFFTDNFKPYLKNYIHSLGTDEVWLFPSKRVNAIREHMIKENLQYQQKKIISALGFHFMLKYFRNTLITNYAEKKIKEGFREGLMNHVGRSVEWQHYIKFDIAKKRAIFDKYFPYKDFPYF